MRIVRYKPKRNDWFDMYEQIFIEDSVVELDMQEHEFREFIREKYDLYDIRSDYERILIFERLT